MAEYIEKETVVGILYGEIIEDRIFEKVKALPAADVKPVVKGKWVVETIEDPNGNFHLWACDKCRCYQASRRRFCPDCGAKMAENDYD